MNRGHKTTSPPWSSPPTDEPSFLIFKKPLNDDVGDSDWGVVTAFHIQKYPVGYVEPTIREMERLFYLNQRSSRHDISYYDTPQEANYNKFGNVH